MLVLDAGAFVALERNDRAMWRRLKGALIEGVPPITHGGVVGQVWRGGAGRQVLLARSLRGVETVPLTAHVGRRAGILLASSGLEDAIDAAIVAITHDGDQIITSDPDDIHRLVAVTGLHVDIVAT